MLILNTIPDTRGWSPIQHMIALAAELLEGHVVTAGQNPSILAKIDSVLRPRSRARADADVQDCLLVCPGPASLQDLLTEDRWRSRFRHITAWVIDSFWVEHIPTFIRWSKPFDQLFITTLQDVDVWRRVTGIPTAWLPWGADVLRYGSGGAQRQWDVTRVGRQPPEWEDDTAVAAAAQTYGIRYQGRPSDNGLTVLQNQERLMSVYGDSRYLLAFSNTVHAQHYTHSNRDYLTGRWVDALACGATIAGIAPRCLDARELLWPEATVDLGTTQREPGLQTLAHAVRTWNPDTARLNHQMALRRLDWRWRIKSLAEAYGINPAPLARDMSQLEQRIQAQIAAQTTAQTTAQTAAQNTAQTTTTDP